MGMRHSQSLLAHVSYGVRAHMHVIIYTPGLVEKQPFRPARLRHDSVHTSDRDAMVRLVPYPVGGTQVWDAAKRP
ncbi:hypothetical protein BD310DRAFT_925377 [Dichomitus squalens]|uniref:Uncharacterized protein n=1 Tax=Dichomitus squalens TaxID=114155 RepID=A0A4Q9PXH8_9APHY|nr:hypothetical protein BD310DRAFT_925377 [Dichomitus squalens]